MRMLVEWVFAEVDATNKSFALAVPFLARRTAAEMRFPALDCVVKLVTTAERLGQKLHLNCNLYGIDGACGRGQAGMSSVCLFWLGGMHCVRNFTVAWWPWFC